MLRVEICFSNVVATSRYYLLYIDKSILKKIISGIKHSHGEFSFWI